MSESRRHPEFRHLEIWEDGRMYQHRYRIIRSNGRPQTFKSRWRSPYLDPAGYARLKFQSVTCLVHRLVWEAFNGPIPEGSEINHIDGNKTNNYLSNLEVVSHRQNVAHSVRTGLRRRNESGFIGVRENHGQGLVKPWCAQVEIPVDQRDQYGKVKLCSEYFATSEEAAREQDRMVVSKGWHLAPYYKQLNFGEAT